MFKSILFALPIFARFAAAQTQAAIERCANSMDYVSYQDVVNYETQDTTQFTATFNYNATRCTSPTRIPLNSFTLTDNIGGTVYTCQYENFDASGDTFVQCPITLGQMARFARDGQNDWVLSFNVGVRPRTQTVDNFFIVEYTDNDPAPGPQPSGALKRSLTPREQGRLSCGTGQTYCWTGTGYSCINTSSDVTACGVCPFEQSATSDCTSIRGANAVSCQASRCVVESCQKGLTVNSAQSGCLSINRLAGRGFFF